MAKKDRQKRSARKARQRQRAELEAARATSGQAAPQSDAKSSSIKKSDAQSPKKAKDKGGKKANGKKGGRRGPIRAMKDYFRDVKVEMHQVVWPSRTELRSYSVAVVAMLIVFGVCVWLVDTGFVQALVALTSLRG